MRRVTRKGLIAVAVAGGAMAAAGPAHADAGAAGSATGSPGLVSGNAVQLPVHIPVDVCGNTVDVVAALSPAAENACANRSQSAASSAETQVNTDGGAASAAGGGKEASGTLSGNSVQLPVEAPVNVTGNSVDVVGIGNAAVGNESVNASEPGPAPRPATPSAPQDDDEPPQRPGTSPAPEPAAVLAHTGAEPALLAVPGAGLVLLGGTVLYRRFRPAALS